MQKLSLSIFAFIAVMLSGIPSSEAAIITVPFTWKFDQTTGAGKDQTSIDIRNNGGRGNVEPDSSTVAGSFTITGHHNPPEEFKERLDPLPESTGFRVSAVLSGEFEDTTTVFEPLNGNQTDGFVSVDAFLSLDPGTIPSFNEVNESGPSEGTIDQQRQSNLITVSDGSVISYTGGIDGTTRFGFGVEGEDFQDVSASLRVSGGFTGEETFDIRYHVVPEPLTIFGSLAAGGFGIAIKRRHQLMNKASNSNS